MFTYHTRVAASDTDETATQTLLSAVTMMQDSSILWLGREHVLRAWLEQEHAAMMVASREVELYRRAAFGEDLSVSSWLYRVTSRMGYRNTCIYDGRGRAVAACWAIGVFVTLEGANVLKIPREVNDSLAIEEPFDMSYGKRKIAVPQTQPVCFEPVEVRHSDIDLNGHMNNACYVRIASDLLPQGFEPKHMRIVHERQAKRGENIVPKRHECSGGFVFTLQDALDEPYAVVEFTE